MCEFELIDISQASKIFNSSLPTMRKYQLLGLIKPCKRIGRKDFYNKADIIKKLELLKLLKDQNKSLKEIARYIQQKPKTIFIIDDDKGFIKEMDRFLKNYTPQSSLKIHTETNALVAMDRIIIIQPDLVIVDLCLTGGISGTELCENITKDPRTSHIKIITMSGKLIPEDEFVYHFIKKPFKTCELLDMIEKVIGHTGKC